DRDDAPSTDPEPEIPPPTVEEQTTCEELASFRNDEKSAPVEDATAAESVPDDPPISADEPSPVEAPEGPGAKSDLAALEDGHCPAYEGFVATASSRLDPS